MKHFEEHTDCKCTKKTLQNSIHLTELILNVRLVVQFVQEEQSAYVSKALNCLDFMIGLNISDYMSANNSHLLLLNFKSILLISK